MSRDRSTSYNLKACIKDAVCMALTEKSNPYIVRKKDSEAENSEHLSEINEPTSGFGYFPGYPGYNPNIRVPTYYPQHQAHQIVYNPIMQPFVIPHGYNHPLPPSHSQGHQPASFPGFIYPHIQTQHQGWHPLYQTLPSDHRSSRPGLKTAQAAESRTLAHATPRAAAPSVHAIKAREAIEPLAAPSNAPTDPGESLRRCIDELPDFCRPGKCPPPAAPSTPSVGEPDLNPNSRAEIRRNHQKRLYNSWGEPKPGGLGMYHV